MQTVLITGANGFVGYYLTQKLLAKGYKVIATGKGPCRGHFAHSLFQYYELDFTEKAQCISVLTLSAPHIVVHAGALTQPDICEKDKATAWKINIAGTDNMLYAARLTGALFLYISTDFVFAGNKEIYTETDLLSPVNYYGVTKMEAERKVQDYSGAWAIVRPIMLYGNPVAGRQNILTMIAKTLEQKQVMRLFTDQQRLPTYIGDLTWGLEKMIAQKATGIYHFCGKNQMSPYDIGISVARYLKGDENMLEPVTAATFPQPAARPLKTVFDLQKAQAAFGYQPTSFEAGMIKTFSLMHGRETNALS